MAERPLPVFFIGDVKMKNSSDVLQAEIEKLDFVKEVVRA